MDGLHRRRADRDDFERELRAAGFEDVEIHETHRVHEQAARRSSARAGPRDEHAEIQLNDPQTLYRHWEDSQWNPFEIDLERDREQWRRMEPGTAGSSTGCSRR